MAVTTKKSLLFLAGGAAAAAVVAYAAGAFDPLFKRPSETIAALPEAGEADPKGARLPGADTPAAAPETAAPAPEAPAPAAQEPVAQPETPDTLPQPAEETVVPPSFDVVRVEGDGSIVVAGKAAPNATVDLVVGSNVIGTAIAGIDGHFAVVLDDPLKPGDYQIVLRATAPDNVVAMSVETAVVSVPETPEGQVLALVEEPGKPSQMITLPKPEKPAAAAKPAETSEAPASPAAPATEAPATEAPAVAEPKPADQQTALAKPSEPAKESATPPPAGPAVRVEAVEIDGRKIFVAGVADPGRTVRGYANEILLGDATASPDGRFLIEADRDLKVGDYIIRVDALEPDGVKVAARAAVPFEREPGETIAAVAPPPEPAAPPAVAQPPAEQQPVGQPPAAAEAPATPQTPAATAEESAAAPVQPPAAEAQAPAEPAAPAAPAAEPQATAEALPTQPSLTEMPTTEAPSATAEQPAASGSQPTAEQPTAQPPVAEAPAPATDAPAAKPEPAESQPPAVSPGQQAAQPATPAEPAETPASPPAVAQTPAEQPSTAQPPPAQPPQTPAAAEPETDVATAPAESSDLPSPPSAGGVAEVLAPKLQSVDSAVIIRRGDTLWRISRRVYGRGVRYSTIYLANDDQIEDPDRIWPGQVFKVPEKSNDGEAEADYSTLGDRLTTVPAEGEGAAEPEQ